MTPIHKSVRLTYQLLLLGQLISTGSPHQTPEQVSTEHFFGYDIVVIITEMTMSNATVVLAVATLAVVPKVRNGLS
jgi:hypothetical protein